VNHATADRRLPIALTIAGSDSGGGAGIQADLKTFAAHGLYGASVLTLVTAQSTSAVDAVHLLPEDLVRQQLATVFADFCIGCVKTGALGSGDLIRLVAQEFTARRPPNLVIDPVMISKHGHTLLEPDAVDSLRSELLPLADVVTPNIPEARVLAGMSEGSSREWMLAAGQRIVGLGSRAVLVKGGHRAEDPVDLLLTARETHWLEGERLSTPHTHGTGCTFSAALAANLLQGLPLLDAAVSAKHYITGAIRQARVYGRGINPVEHFWQKSS
jgi:hydroxymethylpyrimidine/phosphomethylpyrimidine kinase